MPYPDDRVNRNLKADRPNALRVPDLTYIATWARMVYVAFIIDVFACRIIGWRVSSSFRTDIALDTLEHALYERGVSDEDPLVHRKDMTGRRFARSSGNT